jgi:hypothetical protein
MMLTVIWASVGSCERQLEQHHSTGCQHPKTAMAPELLLWNHI